MLVAIVGGVVALGVYRKSHAGASLPDTPVDASLGRGRFGGGGADGDNDLLLSDNMLRRAANDDGATMNTKRAEGGGEGVSRIKMARVLHALEANLPAEESVIQVYDYSATPSSAGEEYTVDAMLFNRNTTASKTKRITFTSSGSIVEEYDISPITGEVVEYETTDDLLDNVLRTGDGDASTGVKFVRDAYSFLDAGSEADLPPEPKRPKTNNPADLAIYERHMALYRQQVEEVRTLGTHTRKKKTAFVPTETQPLPPGTIFPHDMPRSYVLSAAEEAPIDYSQLSHLRPMGDEKFLNSLSHEKSALGIQYG